MVLLDRLTAATLPASGRPRLVVFFTNGSFDGIIGRYVATAKKISGIESTPPFVPQI
jgi:hypothetical protein